MKNNTILIFLFLILLAGCSKNETETHVLRMNELTVPDHFNWNASTLLTLHLSGIPAGVTRISSENGSELYHKFYCDGSFNQLDVDLLIPSCVRNLMINEYLVSISGNEMNVSLQRGLKSTPSANYSMSFDGTSAWIRVASANNITFSNQYSCSAWVWASRQQTAKIIQKGDWDGLGLGQDFWNGWQTSVAFSDGTSCVLNWGQERPVLNRWYFLTGTYDGTTVKMYVDGVMKASTAVSKNIRSNGRFVSIASDAGNQKFFQGLLDEVTLWNVALTPQQISSGHTNGFTGAENGLKGYWKFNEGSGTVSQDASSGLHTGENINSLYNTDVGYSLTTDTDQDGVPDTYDDYPNDPQRAFNNYFPTPGVNTLAFEDLWPGQGDYDFNDLVLGYRINTVTNALGKITETDASFVIRAIGASFRNGFGFNLPHCSIPLSAMTCTGPSLHEGYITLASNGFEASQDKPTVIVFDNAGSLLHATSGTSLVNVEEGTQFVAPDTVRIHLVYPPGTYTLNQLGMTTFNPFLIVNKTRGREIHLPDNPPTSLADPTLFGTGGDDSKPSSGKYYATRNNLPWVVNIPGSFDYPIEKQDILSAYPKMADWARSGAALYTDWYMALPGYRVAGKIYTP